MKKYYSVILMAVIIVLVAANAALGANITVYLNGQSQTYNPAPVIQKGTTIVPMRAIFEQLGANIDWNGQTRTVTATKDDIIISLTIGETVAYVNGRQVALAIPSQTINGRTMVPLRFVSEALGATVKWDAKTWSIYIDSVASGTTTTSPSGTLQVSDIAKNSSSVVLISTFDGNGRPLGFGSGFVVRENGVIATNYHVIDGAASATVKFENGNTYNAKYITSYNEQRDIAILKIDATGLTALKIGDSSKCIAGEKVVAIGNPLGLQNTVSDGIISSLNRIVENQGYIQITAPISPGSSGGPLFNMSGEVIGINSAGFTTGQNLNLAIPINEVKNMFDGSLNIPLTELNQTIGNNGNSVTRMTDQEFVDYIYENYSARSIGGSTVEISEVTLDWVGSNSDVPYLILKMDNYNFPGFVDAMANGNEQNLQDWLNEVAGEMADRYPEGDAMVGFMFQDYFDEYPSVFSADNISYDENGWLVTWIPYSILITDGEIGIGGWNEP